MTRKKVELRLIENENARRASLKKRKGGLTKKVSELHTLCAVSTFLIVLGPDDTEPPTIWPPSPAIEQLITHYQSLPKMEQCKKNLDQEGYLTQRLKKVHDELKKSRLVHKQARASYLMHQMEQGRDIDEFSDEELESLIWLMDTRVKHYMGIRDHFSTFYDYDHDHELNLNNNVFEARSSGGAPAVSFMQDDQSPPPPPRPLPPPTSHMHGHPDPGGAATEGLVLGFPNYDLSNSIDHPNNPYFPSLL